MTATAPPPDLRSTPRPSAAPVATRDPAPARRAGSRWPRSSSTPLICLGLPTWALLYEAPRRTDPVTHVTSLHARQHHHVVAGLLPDRDVGQRQAVADHRGHLGRHRHHRRLRHRHVPGHRRSSRSCSPLSGVLANFGGIPLAFCFIATVGTAGEVDQPGPPRSRRASRWTRSPASSLVYPYFLIPLMVLVIVPTLEGLRPQWREAARNLGASTWQFWRYVGLPGADAVDPRRVRADVRRRVRRVRHREGADRRHGPADHAADRRRSSPATCWPARRTSAPR